MVEMAMFQNLGKSILGDGRRIAVITAVQMIQIRSTPEKRIKLFKTLIYRGTSYELRPLFQLMSVKEAHRFVMFPNCFGSLTFLSTGSCWFLCVLHFPDLFVLICEVLPFSQDLFGTYNTISIILLFTH